MNLNEIRQLASILIETSFLPRAIQNEQEIVAIILTGAELGFGPMASLRLISIIHGKPIVDAAAQLGLMKKAGLSFTWTETGLEVAELTLSDGERELPAVRYTAEDADAAGLLGGATWSKHRGAMLRARCVSKAAKMYAPEVLAGIYVPDEGEEIARSNEVTSTSSVSEIVIEGDPEMAAKIVADKQHRADSEQWWKNSIADLDAFVANEDPEGLDQWAHYAGPTIGELHRNTFRKVERRFARACDALGLDALALKEAMLASDAEAVLKRPDYSTEPVSA